MTAQPDTVPTLRWPDEAALTPARCAACGGTLIDLDPPYQARCVFCSRTVCTYTVVRPRPPLADDDLHPRRGRPPGGTPKPMPKVRAYKSGDTAITQLLDLLSDGQRWHRDDLCEVLDIGSLHVRQLIFQLRERGHKIVTIKSDYLLLSEVRS